MLPPIVVLICFPLIYCRVMIWLCEIRLHQAIMTPNRGQNL